MDMDTYILALSLHRHRTIKPIRGETTPTVVPESLTELARLPRAQAEASVRSEPDHRMPPP
jgi:hypothetical protein